MRTAIAIPLLKTVTKFLQGGPRWLGHLPHSWASLPRWLGHLPPSWASLWASPHPALSSPLACPSSALPRAAWAGPVQTMTIACLEVGTADGKVEQISSGSPRQNQNNINPDNWNCDENLRPTGPRLLCNEHNEELGTYLKLMEQAFVGLRNTLYKVMTLQKPLPGYIRHYGSLYDAILGLVAFDICYSHIMPAQLVPGKQIVCWLCPASCGSLARSLATPFLTTPSGSRLRCKLAVAASASSTETVSFFAIT